MKQNKLIAFLNKFEDIVLVILYAVMVAVIFLQIIMRLFEDALLWSEELGKFIFIWLSWIGISIGHRRGEHITITMFTDKLSFKGKKVCAIISELVLIVLCSVTLWQSVLLMISQWNITYAGIKISTAFGFMAVAVGCGIMVLRCIEAMIKYVKEIKTGEPLEMDPEEGVQA